MNAVHYVGLRAGLIAGLALITATISLPVAVAAAEEESQIQQAANAVEEASEQTVSAVEGFMQNLNDSRLRNQSRDEIIAWILIGVMVGSVAGMMTSLKSTRAGKAGRLLLGLAGAFVGGMIVRMAGIDYGWGAVVLGYEEVLYSLAAAVVFVIAGRLIRAAMKKKKSS
jgi:uncharacterized membrane protein YeaQ/YmgE (transglycosylase-associated protein family)